MCTIKNFTPQKKTESVLRKHDILLMNSCLVRTVHFRCKDLRPELCFAHFIHLPIHGTAPLFHNYYFQSPILLLVFLLYNIHATIHTKKSGTQVLQAGGSSSKGSSGTQYFITVIHVKKRSRYKRSLTHKPQQGDILGRSTA
jgi:hypothetical protein